MRVYALIDDWLPEPVEVYVRREEAEAMLAELLADEPSWRSLLSIAELELPEPPARRRERAARRTVGC